MSRQYFDDAYRGSPPQNYERYFVPAIGAPAARGLMGIAALRPGERVLDVACGTGVVARLAAEAVGGSGTVAGLDINPGMLMVARSSVPAGMTIEWHEAGAESMPFADAAFDAVLCQMGLQFMPDRPAALSEMQRVLAPGGRLVLNVVGPTPPLFSLMAEALDRHIGAEAAGFVHQVFSLHDTTELESLLTGAGLRDVSVRAAVKALPLPGARDFLWQYVHSTPLAGAVAQVDDQRRNALEQDVVGTWQEFVMGDSLMLEVRMVMATGWKR